MNENPYAPIDETNEVTPVGSGRGLVRVEGKYLFVLNPSGLPQRCVLSNKTTDLNQISKPMHYVPVVVYLGLFLCGLPGLLILYLILRKPVDITYYINSEVQRSRRNKSLLAVLVLFSGIGLMIYGVSQELVPLVIAGGVMLLGGLIAVARFSNTLIINGHSNGEFRVKGACEAFLQNAMVGVDNMYHDDDFA